MRVFVKNIRGEALMPCSNKKARLLLKEGKAKIYQYKPFTIQLMIPTGESTQKVSVGVDTGAIHIGIAITSGNKVLVKGEVELRDGIHKSMELRSILRKSRRSRNTRYRQSRFLNRKHNIDKWLPPTIQSKIDATFRWVDEFCLLIPNPDLHIEVGKFDIQKIINPNIQGKEYQQGQCIGYYDIRYFVFARDNYTCQVCKKDNKILHTHHILYKSKGGTDRVDNLITVCSECHTSENHKEGHVLYDWMIEHKKVKQYKDPTFMNIIRKRIFQKYPQAIITYGSETSPYRKQLGLEKTHYNDAIAISGIKTITENPNEWLLIRQFRKKKRLLHEATPRKGLKEPNRLQKRHSKNTKNSNGWYLGDCVKIFNKKGYISGFTNNKVYIKDINNEWITTPNKSYKQVGMKNLQFISHNNNWFSEIQYTI